MPRLFVALQLPDGIRASVARLCQGLPDARWTPDDSLHLTLRFIGEVDMPCFQEIGEMLASITAPPFDLALRGIGQFPPRGPLRHLWAGVEAGEELARLRRRIDHVVREAGIELERRRFVPHVTLARFRQPPPVERMASWLARRNLFRTESFPVDSFTLFSSRLRPEGSLYTIEAEYDFVRGVLFQP